MRRTRSEGGAVADRHWSVIYWTAQFRAAGLAVAGLAAAPVLMPRLGGPDPVLLVALAGLAVLSWLVRARLRRHRADPADGEALAGLLAAAVLLTLVIQRTGGPLSPVWLALAALAALGAMTLDPLRNLVALGGICLAQTIACAAGDEGWLASAAVERTTAFLALSVELGLVVLQGWLLNGLAWRLRAQREDLARADLCEPGTGLRTRALLCARLASLLESGHRAGLAAVELVPAARRHLAVAAEIVQSHLRPVDALARLGETALAVALPDVRAADAARIAQRLFQALQAAGLQPVAAGHAHAEPGEARSPVELLEKTEAMLARTRAA